MAAIDNLTEEQIKSLEQAKELITIKMLKNLEYGEEKELNELFTLYHYSEEDIIVIVRSDEWEEVLQILYNEEINEIIFEAL